MRHFVQSRGEFLLCPSCGTDAGDVSKFCPTCGTGIVRAAAQNEETIGKIIAGKYRVEAMIGEGGMGKVYRAKQIALDKQVVLKVLRQSLLSDERTVARFQREAKAASRLNHPNSISILDFGQAAEDGSMYIAMEYVNGRDLHQILSKEWPLPESRVVRIMSQVLSALADAHAAGVIHRDLKPENIMVEQRRGEPDFVKVLDFGIAKIQDSTGDDGPALTRTGFVCGTPEYMSPEQARGATLDNRSDLYAVGVIIYQLAAGLLPFESDSAVGFATKHLTEDPRPPSQRRPEAKISPALESLILKALAKDPNERPQTAEEFRAELLAVESAGRGKTTPVRRSPKLTSAPRSLTSDSADTRLEPSTFDEATLRAFPNELGQEPTASITGTGTKAHTSLALKVVTVSLAAAAVILAGYYFSVTQAKPQVPTSYVVPANAPLPSAGIDDDKPLYDRLIPAERRDVGGAERLSRDGDQAQQAGDLRLAAEKYRQAFAKNPDPQLALKLGEVHYQQDQTQEAKGWWRRHLKERPDSKARRHIQQIFSDL